MSDIKQLADIKELLRSGRFRIDFDQTLLMRDGGLSTTPCARLYERRGKRWVKVGPLLLPPDGAGAAELMEVLGIALSEAARGE